MPKRSSLEHGSVVTRRRRGKEYAYVVSKDGVTRKDRYLGPASDPEVQEEVQRLSFATEQSKALRNTVSLLKQAKIPAPALPLGRVLETVANAGLFERGMVLVGTAAYQTYTCMVGHYLPGSALMTNDADLLVASLVAGDEPMDLETILKNRGSRSGRLSGINSEGFQGGTGFQVDILTKYGRGRKSPILVNDLKCAAEALTFMEYLAEESADGCPIRHWRAGARSTAYAIRDP